MPRPYSDYVKVNKDFVPVFTERSDKDYPMHWLTFYPHDTFKTILSDLIGSLEGDTSEKRKSLWVSGAYGTGKSFSSFTLKHIIEDEGNVVKNYFEKHGIQSTLFNRLQNVKLQSDIIVVHRSSSAGIVGDNRLFSAIQESIKKVLKNKGYSYLGGKTLYDKIIGILKDPNASFNFKGAFLRNKNRFTEYANPEDVIKDLVDLGPEDSLNLLQTIIEIADVDGFNFAQSETEMAQWLEDVIRTNNIKIVFIWDEFSEYFLRNQNSTGGLQELAHASFSIPFYFLLITHRRHDQFIYESDRRKILEARFKMNKIDMVPTTAFMLMRNAIEIEHDLRDDWNNICANLWFNIEKMVRNSLNIYADDIKDEDLKGLLPLHPFSALVLQFISREVNSNQRTMFQFLCGDPDTSEITQHNFRWFIENHDLTNWCYLTSDYIWDYFFHYDNMDLDEKAKSAINHYFTFENLCKNEDEKRVLKVALLLTALKHEKGRGTSNLLRPTLSNITFAFAGTDIADKIRSIMDDLVKRSVFGASQEGSSDFLYISQSQNIDEEKYKEKIASAKANFTFEKIVTNPEYQLTSSFSPSGYAPLRFDYICATHKDLRTKTAKINSIEPNIIPLIFMFAKTEEDKVKNREALNNLLNNSTKDVIFVDLSSQPLSNAEYDNFIKFAALYSYFEKLDVSQASLNLKYAEGVINTWKRKINETQITLYTQNNPPISFNGTIQFAERLNELNAIIFSAGIESIVNKDSIFKTAFSSDVAIMGMDKKQIPSNYKYLTEWKEKLAKDNIWNNAEYFLTMPSHPLAKMKIAVDSLIEESIANNGSVGIIDIWSLLRDKPFGLLPCIGSMFTVGFLLKEYADCGYYKKDIIKYPTPLTTPELADMIHGIIKGLNNADTLSIVRMTERQEKFCKYSGELFKLSQQKQNSIQDVLIGIKDRLSNDGYPLWSLKYYIQHNDRHGLTDVVKPIIDTYCKFVSGKQGEINEAQIAEDIMDLFDRDAGIKEYLCDVYNSSNLREGMQFYINEYKPDLLSIAKRIDDDGRYLDQVKDNFVQFTSWLWEKGDIDKQIDAVYLDYQLIEAINKIIPHPIKKLEDAITAISNRISSIKMPYDFFKNNILVQQKLLISLISIYRTNSFKEINKEELLHEINQHSEEFIDFFLNQQKLFSVSLNSALGDQQLSEVDINKIYSKLETKAINKQLDNYIISLKVICDNYKKDQKYNQLLETWKNLSDTETPVAWSETNKIPILCIFIDSFQEAKEVFDIINVGRVIVSDVKIEAAITFINSNANIKNLNNGVFCDQMFLEFVCGEYEMLISDIDEVKTLLTSRMSCSVYDWYFNKLAIDSVIKEYAEEKYKSLQYIEKVLAKIDLLSADDAKNYLKGLIMNEPLVGIKILNN